MTPPRALLKFAIAAGILLAIAISLPDAPAASPVANAAGDLGQAMGQINRAVKVLAKGIDKDTEGDALKALEEIERAILDAKAAAPESAAEIDEKKRDKFVADYRVMMLELLVEVCNAETAVVQGKYKNVAKVLTKLDTLKSQGHAKYNPKGG